ncbi:MAG: Uncharacterised protein [Owenweeksia sp. TMED14]|nr:MAG: Uncharacterised protein [Owenweeksia sp. TMED14]|tara:strand:- start:192 stop:1217 length:1026 start_codon:yes stop_codon:yes gene_type:complete
MRFSLISPTFKRPQEVQEFIQSLSELCYSRHLFEVILADGTPKDQLRPIIELESKKYDIPITIVFEEYLPVSDARNAAAVIANGKYLIFLDSDCLLPKNYLEQVDVGLKLNKWDAFGGPDSASPEFSPLQKAISFSMTSFWTTGGLRGGKLSTTQYYPRGFNMGVRKDIFDSLNGFDTRFKTGEDVEFSIRLVKANHKVGLIPEAIVYHKRRSDLFQFFKQVRRFGGARWSLSIRHKGQLKLTHMFPVFLILSFILGSINFFVEPSQIFDVFENKNMSLLVNFFFCFVVFYFFMPFLLAGIKYKSPWVGLLSLASTFVMMLGYAVGFLEAVFGGSVHRKRG